MQLFPFSSTRRKSCGFEQARNIQEEENILWASSKPPQERSYLPVAAVASVLLSPSLFNDPCWAVDMNAVAPGVASVSPSISYDSVSASRLLVNPNSNVKLPSESVRRVLSEQQDLQDQRLDQCQESGKNWEQCFFYGTAAGGQNPARPVSVAPSNPKPQIPTW